jgi:23S rRNA (guanosine2251-2'-O)-methyltransferase
MAHPMYVILHNIRSAYNVGAILRTADGAGATKVYLGGYTPAPIDRFGRKRADIAKAALGAQETVLWEQSVDTAALIRALVEQGVYVVAVEQDVKSIPYTALDHNGPVALLFGEEVHGISAELLHLCAVVAEIPMHGTKESLNVSVAAGIVLYHCGEKKHPIRRPETSHEV